MAANQKLRRENPHLVPRVTGYFLNGNVFICQINQPLPEGCEHFVGFAEKPLTFTARQTT